MLFRSENGVVSYAEGCNILTSEEKMKEEAVKVAEESDVVILVLGGSSSRFGKVVFDTNGAAVAKDGVTMDCGEGVDCADLNLPSAQRELAEAIFSTGKPVISVIISGRPMVLSEESEAAHRQSGGEFVAQTGADIAVDGKHPAQHGYKGGGDGSYGHQPRQIELPTSGDEPGGGEEIGRAHV